MSDYDMGIHSNRDAQAWAKFFMETWKNKLSEIEEVDMIAWFTNAMMAMHDSIYQNEIAEKDEQLEEMRSKCGDLAIQSIGWMYAEACVQMDKGKDIRRVEIPWLIKRLENELLNEWLEQFKESE